MICKNCSKILEEDAYFCNYCGSEIATSSPSSKKVKLKSKWWGPIISTKPEALKVAMWGFWAILFIIISSIVQIILYPEEYDAYVVFDLLVYIVAMVGYAKCSRVAAVIGILLYLGNIIYFVSSEGGYFNWISLLFLYWLFHATRATFKYSELESRN